MAQIINTIFGTFKKQRKVKESDEELHTEFKWFKGDKHNYGYCKPRGILELEAWSKFLVFIAI